METAPGVGDPLLQVSTQPRSNSNRSNTDRVPLGIQTMPEGSVEVRLGRRLKSPSLVLFRGVACHGQSHQRWVQLCAVDNWTSTFSINTLFHPKPLLPLRQVCLRMLSQHSWKGRLQCWWSSQLRRQRPVSSQPDWSLQLVH